LRLEEDAVDLWHPLGHIGGHFRLGGDGISEIMAAAGPDRRIGDGLVARHQYSFWHSSASLLFYSDDAVRAHGGAEGAADALGLVGHLRGGIAFFVDLVLGNGQDVLGAGLHAQSAALAEVRLERYFCHGGSSFYCCQIELLVITGVIMYRVCRRGGGHGLSRTGDGAWAAPSARA